MDTVRQSLSAIAKVQPKKLYLASDGPRQHVQDEQEIVTSIRNFMQSNITWECDAKLLFRDENLGCKNAVSSAIDWFFDYEYEGIIIEDDCLPEPSFFHFCSKLLKDYRNDLRVGMITGTSYLFNEVTSDDDYFFSKYCSVWGWATWRDRWQLYDANVNFSSKSEAIRVIQKFISWDAYVANFYIRAHERVENNLVDTWDYQWVFTCMQNDFYCLTPYKNLIKNIGESGTRVDPISPFLNMDTSPVSNLGMLVESDLEKSFLVDKQLFFNVFYRFSRKRLLKFFARFLLSAKYVFLRSK